MAKKSGARGDGSSSKTASSTKNTPPPLPPPTRPDEQLYWLDLTIDRKWDLRLNRPFDRAIGVEVLSYVHPLADSALPSLPQQTPTKVLGTDTLNFIPKKEASERDAEGVWCSLFAAGITTVSGNWYDRTGVHRRSRGRFCGEARG